MSVRTTALNFTVVSGAGVAQTSVPVQAALSVPPGINPVDSAGEAIDQTPIQATSDPSTGAVSIAVIPPGDIYQNVAGSLVALAGCTWTITYLSTILTSPSFAYTATLNPLSWSSTPASLGLLKCYLTDVFGNATPVTGRTYTVALSQDATWSGGIGANRQIPGGAAYAYTTAGAGTITVYLVRQSELTPSGTDWVLVDTVSGTIRYFQVPTTYTGDAGVYAGGTTYAINQVVRRAVDDEPFISLTNSNTGNPLTDAVHWADYAGENILLRTVSVSPPGQQAVSAANIAATGTVPGSLVGSPASVQDILSNLLYTDAYGNLTVQSKTTTYTVLPGDDAVLGDCSGGNWTLTLDSPATHLKVLYLARKDATTAVWSVAPPGGKTINGSASALSLLSGMGVALIPVSSTDWRTIASYGDYPTVLHNGTSVAKRNIVNLIDGSNFTMTVTDNPGAGRVDVTGAAAAVLGQANQLGSSSALAQPAIPVEGTSLIDRLRGGYHSNELWTITSGIREFDLAYYAGVYYLAYDDNTQVCLRHASTIAGLAAATNDTTIAGRYPSLLYDGTTWHVWVYDPGGTTLRHYTHATFAAGFVNVDSPAFNYSDPQVRQSPNDGLYYMAYTSLSPYGEIGIMSAGSLSGPWTDLGLIFSAQGDPPFAPASGSTGQFDPTPIFWNARVYCAFLAWDAAVVARIALVELDPSNSMKALGTPTVIVDPLETWQQAGSAALLSNPVWLAIPNQPGQGRLYYTHKPTSTFADGLAYVQVGTAPPDGRRQLDYLRLNTAVGLDVAAGLQPHLHGGATWGAAGLVAGATPSGAYGVPAGPNMTDFTLAIEFAITTIPGADGLLLRISGAAMAAQPELAMWVTSAGKLKAALIASTTVTLTGTTTMVAGTVYRGTFRRLGSAMTLYLGGNLEASGTQPDTLTGLVEWSVANDKGATQAAGEQLLCTVFGAAICGEALQLSADPLLGLPLGAGGGGGGGYTLPTASSATKGGVKIGPNSTALGLEAGDGTIGVGALICMQSGTTNPPVPCYTSAGDDYVYLSP